MKTLNLFWLLGLGLFFAACEQTNTLSDPSATGPTKKAGSTYTADQWIAGPLSQSTDVRTHVVANDQLKPLGVTLSGSKLFKSNNPEIYRGSGWLMQNSRTDATRGGKATPLSGTQRLYLFHINQSNATRYLHVLVTNPNAANITVSAKGSYYTNAEKPLTGSGTGQSYFVSKDWLNNTLRFNKAAVSIAQYKATELCKIPMNHGNMADALIEITTSANAYYYTVVTSTGNTTDAIAASQGSYAAGDYYTESTNSYGREAGIYEFNQVSAANTLELPNQAAHFAFALNTANKFWPGLENQNAAALMTLTGASSKSYGNYGHKYSLTTTLQNNNSSAKTVRMYLASNTVDPTKSNATYNGPILMNGAVRNVYTTLNAPRQLMATWTVQPGIFNAQLEFYVPGLISSNQQLIFEVL